jgi:hypothetical protein
MPATSQRPSGRSASRCGFQSEGSDRRKRVSARHQVKRPDRGFEELAPRKSFRQKKQVILVRCGSHGPRFHRSPSSSVKSVPDVFADALVPGTPSFPERPRSPAGVSTSLRQPDPSTGDGKKPPIMGFVPLFPAPRGRGSGLVCYCDLDDRVMQWGWLQRPTGLLQNEKRYAQVGWFASHTQHDDGRSGPRLGWAGSSGARHELRRTNSEARNRSAPGRCRPARIERARIRLGDDASSANARIHRQRGDAGSGAPCLPA